MEPEVPASGVGKYSVRMLATLGGGNNTRMNELRQLVRNLVCINVF